MPPTLSPSASATSRRAVGLDSVLTGVLTLRSRSAVQVDPGGLVVTIDGDRPRRHGQAGAPDASAGPCSSSTRAGRWARRDGDGAHAPRRSTSRPSPPTSWSASRRSPTPPVSTSRRRSTGAPSSASSTGSRREATRACMPPCVAATKSLGTTGDRSIVLLSDGADTVAKNAASALADAVDRLRAGGVRVDVVRFKTNDPDASAALNGFASANGGSVVPAADTAAVARSLPDVGPRARPAGAVHGAAAQRGRRSAPARAEGGRRARRRSPSRDRSPSATGTPVPTSSPTPTPVLAQGAVATLAAPRVQSYLPWAAAALVGLAVVIVAHLGHGAHAADQARAARRRHRGLCRQPERREGAGSHAARRTSPTRCSTSATRS